MCTKSTEYVKFLFVKLVVSWSLFSNLFLIQNYKFLMNILRIFYAKQIKLQKCSRSLNFNRTMQLLTAHLYNLTVPCIYSQHLCIIQQRQKSCYLSTAVIRWHQKNIRFHVELSWQELTFRLKAIELALLKIVSLVL